MATNGPDSILGTVGDDILDGLDGSDSIDGGIGGIDTLIGGAGDDLLWTRTSDEAYGGSGNDIVSVTADQPLVLDGGIDTDTLRFESSYDITGATLTGFETLALAGTGIMTAAQLATFSLVTGYASNYTTANLQLSLGGTATVNLSSTLTNYFFLTGSNQADRITFNSGFASIIYAYMGEGNDKVTTGAGNDSIRGEEGSDTLSGLAGNDSIDGGLGADSLIGGDGNDTLYVSGADSVFGSAGNDLLSIGGNNAVLLNGGAGQDTIRFESSYDISGANMAQVEQFNLNGDVRMTTAQLEAVDLVSGYASNYTSATMTLTDGGTAGITLSSTLSASFTLNGSSQANILTFAPGYFARINVNAAEGNDSIVASSGSDSLRGEIGNDTLQGLLGNDTLDGSIGADSLEGGGGNDSLWIDTGGSALGGNGDDIIAVTGDFPAFLDGGIGQDTLRFETAYDITGATVQGFEQLNLNGAVRMTTTQLGLFSLVSGYASNYSTAAVVLTQGGTAAITVSSTLNGGSFFVTGSSEAEALTFTAGYTGIVYAYMAGGNDFVVTSSGNDSIRGEEGNDTLAGADGNDSIDGGDGADSISGGAGADTIYSRYGDDVLGGTENDLILISETGVASVNGGGAFDILRFEINADVSGTTILGFEQGNFNSNVLMTAAQLGGFATVAGYATNYTTAGVTLTQGGTANVVLASTLTAYFSLTGSGDADILTFDPTYTATVYAYVAGGDDNVTGASGADSMRGEEGADTLLGNSGNDSIDGGVGNDSLGGNAGNDSIIGGEGIDFMDGALGNDTLVARQNDSVYGGGDDDLISVAESLPAVLAGGGGTDTLRFESAYDISDAAMSGFENLNLNGTVLMRAAQLATFTTVSGYASNYTTATLRLTEGGTVAINLSSTLTGGFTLGGSVDADIISFNVGFTAPITVNASYGNDSITGATGVDTLRGDQGNDTLTGLNGNDSLDGGSGADRLVGGLGIDTMTGGTGRDVFVFATTTASVNGTPDRINDFEAAGVGLGDLIDVSAIDADGGLGAQDSFIFGSIGLAGLSLTDSGTDTLVQLNTDNDAAFEAVILIADGAVLAANYTAADFTL